ncbi:MAG: CoA pyrophosphatase, partial [Candidatus Latescibacteria bacterium]|nr:CoA pyrophosphatase [Candidatus Latescibacterota bacterium]
MNAIADIREALGIHQPLLTSPGGKGEAAVSLVLHEPTGEPELLYMERTAHGEDPWSGHIAFPGGRVEDQDPDLKHTA